MTKGEEGPSADAENVLVHDGCWPRVCRTSGSFPMSRSQSQRALSSSQDRENSEHSAMGTVLPPGLILTLPRSLREWQCCPWSPGNGLLRPHRAWSWPLRFFCSWLRWLLETATQPEDVNYRHTPRPVEVDFSLRNMGWGRGAGNLCHLF